jgi:cobalt-precorrin 5A hydrolase
MGVDKTMIVAGIGCRRGTSAAEIEGAIRAALARAEIDARALGAIATIAAKRGEAGIEAAAKALGVSVVVVSERDCYAVSARTRTRSERSLALTGLPSVAESAALAAAGPSAELIGARLVAGAATCALAASPEAAAETIGARS